MASGRPLSPHLEIYRWYFTMALSIAHRVTGAGLVLGLLLFTWWLNALAIGPNAFATAQWLVGSVIGQLVLFGLTFVLFFHLANGIRHLVWDLGYGFDIHVARQSGIAVVAAAAGLTLVVWILALVIG
jgi:succinate dehydrogenase / fumarate reductase, cytochrome b subunit